MKALIFAAGLGTRLRPLTDKLPKALIPVAGKPMLQWVTEKLIAGGVTDIVINVHHHPDILIDYISKLKFPGIQFHISDERDQLLDTGGGLKQAEVYLNGPDPFIVHNADVLSNINLKDMFAFHKSHKPLATLAVSSRNTSRHFLWEDDRLAGWENNVSGEKILCQPDEKNRLRPLAFSGIHILCPKIFSLINEKGRFSIKDLYLRLAASHHIAAYEHDPRYWFDIGSPEKLENAETVMTGLDLSPKGLFQLPIVDSRFPIKYPG
jgi:N-acetyl-alpha-D-muramate 1-phosphate uridylyltransferase